MARPRRSFAEVVSIDLRSAPKSKTDGKRSRMDVIIITPAILSNWKLPDFQRPLRVNVKVLQVAELIKNNGGIVPGTIILGQYHGDTYIVDGQHRVEAFKLSKLNEGLIDARIIEFDDPSDMAQEFAEANDHLVRMAPDDRLRALEKTVPALFLLRQRCPFIGYGAAQRGSESTPIVSMTLILRVWSFSATETPSARGTGGACDLARRLVNDDAERCIEFLNAVYRAWGRDLESTVLWNQLNLTLCAWLWRRVVTGAHSSRTTTITPMQFQKGASSLATNDDYMDWLRGKKLGDRDRSACYLRMRQIYTQRLKDDGMRKVILPAPPWFSNNGRSVV